MSDESILLNANKEQQGENSFTFAGGAGSGKTSLACMMPGKSFYIRGPGEKLPADLSSEYIPDCLGETDTYDKLVQQCMALLKDNHDYKNVIFDAATTFDTMFVDGILRSEGKSNLALCGGGHGAGYGILESRHAHIRKICHHLQNKRNMRVIFIAHSDIKDISPPDGETYSHYTLRLNKKSMPFYIDKVDFVGFIRQPVLLVKENEKKDARKRLVESNEREILCTLSPAAVAKNRLGITENLQYLKGENPLLPYIDPTFKKAEPQQAQSVQELDGNDDNEF